MPLFSTRGARRYNERITLTLTEATSGADTFGHAALGAAQVVGTVYAEVRQMSATKTMLTFQQADVVGVDLEFRLPAYAFNGIRWKGHDIHFPTPEIVDERGRVVRVSGWYQIDNPTV